MSGKQAKNARKRLEHLISQAELSENEILIAVEEYKLKQTKPKSLVVFKLPGTDLEVSMAERHRLTKMASDRGISSGYYESWELAQFGQAVADARDDQFMEILIEGFLPYLDFGLELERRLERIVGLVNGAKKLWHETDDDPPKRIFPYTDEDAGELSKLWTQLAIKADYLDAPKEMLPHISPFVIGIKNLINRNDDGESLREAVAAYRPVSEQMLNWIMTQPKPGPKEKSKAKQQLDIWVDEMRSENVSWEDIGDLIPGRLCDEAYPVDMTLRQEMINVWENEWTDPLGTLKQRKSRRATQKSLVTN